MAVIGALVSGVGIIANSPRVQNTQYNKLTLFGQGDFDKVVIRNYLMTDTMLDAITPVNYTWDTTMNLYAEFNNNLQAGSLQTSGIITAWNIFRYCCGSSSPTTIALGLDGSETAITDYTALRNQQYYYKIFPITSTAVVSSLESNVVTPCYNSWILLDETSGVSFNFDLNVESGVMTQNTSVSEYVGFTQYPAISQSAQNYMSTQINAYLGYMENDELIDTIDLYDLLITFVSNGNVKILKDRKGDICCFI